MGKKRGLSPLQVSEWQTLPFYGPMVDIPLTENSLVSEDLCSVCSIHKSVLDTLGSATSTAFASEIVNFKRSRDK